MPRSIYQSRDHDLINSALRRFEAFGSKLQFFLSFLCLLIPKKDLDTKKTTSNIELCSGSLAALLEYWYIEHGLLRRNFRPSSDVVLLPCRNNINSGINFDKSTTEARRLNQTFELNSASKGSTSSAVLHDSGTTAIQASCFCRAKLC